MKRGVVFFLLVSTFLLSAFGQSKNGFREENDYYYATADGTGATESEASNRAKYSALDVIFDQLQKDRLFREMFFKNPPISIAFTNLKTDRQLNGSFKSTITVKLDGEAIRMMYSGPYLQTVNNLLDRAEIEIAELERSMKEATNFELNRKLAESETAYWQLADRSDSILAYLAPIEDSVIMSTKGRRKSPEIKAAVTSYQKRAREGIARLKSSEQELVADEELRNFSDLLESIDAENVKAVGLLEKSDPIIQTPENYQKANLEKVKSELGIELRALEEAKASLDKNAGKLPADKAYLKSRIDITYQRMSKNMGSLRLAIQSVEREILDPSISRAERDAFIKWFLFHESNDWFALRWFPPFGLNIENTTTFVYTDRFDFSIRAEGAFAFGDGGFWAKTELKKTDFITTASTSEYTVKNTSYGQDAAIGFYGSMLVGAGVSWDWFRTLDNEETSAKGSSFRAIIGGVDTATPKAVWLLSVAYNFPPSGYAFNASRDLLNLSLEGLVRLGTIAVIEGKIGKQIIASGPSSLDSVFVYNIGGGIRVPAPFMWGIEYSGMTSEALNSNFSLSGNTQKGNYFRMFIEYSF